MSAKVKQWQEVNTKSEKYTEFFEALGCECVVESQHSNYGKSLTLTRENKSVRLIANSSMLEVYIPVVPKQDVYRLTGKFLGDNFVRDFPRTDDGYKAASDLQSRLDVGSEIIATEVEVTE